MAEVLERGAVHFFYRPRVERNAPRGEDDVQRFIVVLAPEDRAVWRMLYVGRKRLPDLARRGRERNWAWVARVTGDPADLEGELRGYTYGTKTRGVRQQPSARPAGDGAYALARHHDHSHLAYALVRPDPPGDVQRELGIAAAASYVVAVKNPEWRDPARADQGLARSRRPRIRASSRSASVGGAGARSSRRTSIATARSSSSSARRAIPRASSESRSTPATRARAATPCARSGSTGASTPSPALQRRLGVAPARTAAGPDGPDGPGAGPPAAPAPIVPAGDRAWTS